METIAHRKCDVDLVGVQRHATWNQRDFVESIRAARPAADPDLEAGLLRGNLFAGLRPALIQGVFAPCGWRGC